MRIVINAKNVKKPDGINFFNKGEVSDIIDVDIAKGLIGIGVASPADDKKVENASRIESKVDIGSSRKFGKNESE